MHEGVGDIRSVTSGCHEVDDKQAPLFIPMYCHSEWENRTVVVLTPVG